MQRPTLLTAAAGILALTAFTLGDGLLDATLEAVEEAGGVTALPAEAASSNIDSWIEKLDGMDGTMAVTANLRELRAELTSGDINGTLAAVLLTTLAEDTRKLAPDNDGIAALATALNAGAEQLYTPVPSEASLLDQTVAAVFQLEGDITTLPVASATTNIDLWIEKLSAMPGTAAMVSDLTALKTELESGEIDGDKASELMFSLARGTKRLADGNKALEVLAYALEAGAWRLR